MPQQQRPRRGGPSVGRRHCTKSFWGRCSQATAGSLSMEYWILRMTILAPFCAYEANKGWVGVWRAHFLNHLLRINTNRLEVYRDETLKLTSQDNCSVLQGTFATMSLLIWRKLLTLITFVSVRWLSVLSRVFSLFLLAKSCQEGEERCSCWRKSRKARRIESCVYFSLGKSHFGLKNYFPTIKSDEWWKILISRVWSKQKCIKLHWFFVLYVQL